MFVAAMILCVSCGSKKEVKTVEETLDFYDDGQTSESSYSSSLDNGYTDWDSFLDEYENFVDKSIELYNNTKKDKTKSNILKLRNVQIKHAQLVQKVSNVSGEMSTSQLQRYTNINHEYATLITKISELAYSFDDDDDDNLGDDE